MRLISGSGEQWQSSRTKRGATSRAFDSMVRRVHNRHQVLARRFVAVVLLSVLAVAPCLGVCAGWSASSETRMACCAGKSSDEATMCCAASERRQHGYGSGPIVVTALPAPDPCSLAIASALVPELRTEAIIESVDLLASDSARHVRLSVFLI